MAKTAIVIGEKEKHTLEIGWSNWLGDVTIKIDGLLKKDLPFQDPYFWTTFQRAYDFTVGESEPHSVHIETDGNYDPPISVLTVDGKATQLPLDESGALQSNTAGTRFEVHPRLYTFQGVLKFDLMGSTEQEPITFWQRHFEGKQVAEELQYSDFLVKTKTALSELGFQKLMNIKLDHNEVYTSKALTDSSHEEDIGAGINAALTELGASGGKEVSHEVEINAAKITDFIREHLQMSYSIKHEVNKQPLSLYVRFAPIDSAQDKKQSLGAYQNELNAKYGSSIKNDFTLIYRKVSSIFPLLPGNQVLHLEDPQGLEISLDL